MNIPLAIKKRVNKLDYLFVFLLIIYAAGPTIFVRSFNSWEDIVGLLFICLFTLFYAIKNKIKYDKSFYMLAIAFIIYFLALTVKFGELHPRFLSIYLISFWITYVTITKLRYRVFVFFEEIMYYLCAFSLFFWGLYQLIPEQFTNFMDSIAFSEPSTKSVKANIILYTINDIAVVPDYVFNFGSINLIRNPGFCWEPGAFASFICIALYIHFIKIKFNKMINKRFLVYLLSLITTFSTTGYGIFIILIMFYAYNQLVKYKVIYLVIFSIITPYIISLSFMSDKVIDLYKQDDSSELIDNSIKYDVNYAPQRITSFVIDFKDFLNNPILGYGGHIEEAWTAKLGADISTISGIGKVFARFGLVGVIFFFVMLIRSSKLQSQIFGFKGWGFPFLIIIMISISYSFIEYPLLMCFWMVALFYPKPAIYSKVTDKFKHKWIRQK